LTNTSNKSGSICAFCLKLAIILATWLECKLMLHARKSDVFRQSCDKKRLPKNESGEISHQTLRGKPETRCIKSPPVDAGRKWIAASGLINNTYTGRPDIDHGGAK